MFGAIVLAVVSSVPAIDAIRIESRWGGLGQPSAKTYTILHRGDRYERGSAIVATDAVTRFAAAITAAPVERNTAIRGIATRDWLATRASEDHADSFVPTCSAEAKRLLAAHLVDPKEAVKALNEYYSVRWTDDYPFVSIDVTFHDRRTLHLESRDQHALMLPWNLGNSETWNPDISRAIVALLPQEGEPRLADRQLARAYVEQVASQMRVSIDDLEERCVHRSFLEAAEKQFQIVRVYHGSPGWFTAYVRRSDFPPNLVLTLVIRDDEEPEAPAKLERTVQRTGAYVALARAYVERHAKKNFAIWCADGVSVEANERAVRISEYDPASGIVSNPRVI